MAEKVYLRKSRRYLGATRSGALRIRRRTLYIGPILEGRAYYALRKL